MNTAVATRETAPLLRYDAMCHAIQAAYEVDEVADIRDRAVALEHYFRLAENTEAERLACEIRLRAERKAGAILRTMQKAKGSPGNQHTGPLTRSEGTKTLADLGITHNQSSQWQKLAEVPEAEFEAALKAPEKPTTGGIIAGHMPREKPRDQVDARALWLWGRLLDFEREGLLDEDPEALMASMLDHMKDATREMAPRVAAWLGRIR